MANKQRKRINERSFEDVIDSIIWFFTESIWAKPAVGLILAIVVISILVYNRQGYMNPFDPALHPELAVDPTPVPSPTVPPPTAIPAGEGSPMALKDSVQTGTITYVCPVKDGQQQQLAYALQLVNSSSGRQVRAITGREDRYTPIPNPVPEGGVEVRLKVSCEGFEEHAVGRFMPGDQYIPSNSPQ